MIGLHSSAGLGFYFGELPDFPIRPPFMIHFKWRQQSQLSSMSMSKRVTFLGIVSCRTSLEYIMHRWNRILVLIRDNPQPKKNPV